MFIKRTDLALEARELWQESAERTTRLMGVKATKSKLEGYPVTRVDILDHRGEEALGKPQGSYLTIDLTTFWQRKADFFERAVRAVGTELKALLPVEGSALVVGLGNREVTADALGPQVVDNLLITRHVVKNYGKAAYNCTRMNLVSSIEPGVMAKTGMETAEIISGVVKETGPDVLIVVDALAARSTRRLNRTIQITNTGIQPGSGVGNHRNALTQETLGVPVIAIGIPTVVDAATIVGDALEKLMSGEKEFDAVKYMGQHRMAFAELNNMYMTGKDIDSVVKRVSYTVSEGINIAMEKSFVV